MTWDRIERLLGAEALAHLHQKQVAIIGLGSGGGFVATGLAMSGVGHFVLLDDDHLKAHNVVRHVGDHRDVGRPKVDVVADQIAYRHPQAQVRTIQGRIENHPEALDGVDLVICAVDGEGAKFTLNELCRQKQLAALYAGVYERGDGGDVTLIYPDSGPCYACWASNLREGFISPSPDGSPDLDYGLMNDQGTLDAEPGLWLHVVRVAAVQADIALNYLIKQTAAHRPLPANTVILANRAIEIVADQVTPPQGAVWVDIPRDPNCLVCGLQAATDRLSLDNIAHDLVRFEDEETQKGNTANE